jgi:hypothetical protein
MIGIWLRKWLTLYIEIVTDYTARRTNSSAVEVVPNVEVRVEVQHSIRRLGFHGLLGKALPLHFFTDYTKTSHRI